MLDTTATFDQTGLKGGFFGGSNTAAPQAVPTPAPVAAPKAPQVAAPAATPVAPTTTTPVTPTTPTATSATTKTSTKTTTEVDPNAANQKRLAQAEAEYQTQAKSVHDTILKIQNGAIPLTAGEQAQVDGLKSQFQNLIDQQVLTNKSATGIANVRGYQTGAAEYDPNFQVKTIGAIVTAGANKVADLNTKMASAVAALTQSFKDDDIAAVKDAWNVYKEASKERTDAIQKVIDDTNAKLKEDEAKRQKIQDDVDSLALDAAKNGASKDVLDAISSSSSVSEALSNAGSWLQTASGKLGEYLDYKRQAMAEGKVPVSFDSWEKADDAKEAAREASKAYGNAYASAKGKAAGEAAAGVTSLKPLTESQGRDLTYAQRADQGNSIIDTLQGNVVSMNPASYALQVKSEGNTFLNQYVDPDVRAIRQAERNFLTAVLRRESGAQISDSEFATGELQYFPRPGDDEITLQNKSELRNLAIQTFKQNVPDYDARVSQTTSGMLNQAEDLAQSTVINYGNSNPQAQAAIKQMVAEGMPYTEIKQLLGI